MESISVFDVLGPIMIGPSSSHTAGACTIARLAQEMMKGPIEKVEFTLYGSFARTGRGHGTDRALVGGIMGFDPEDERIRDSFELARERGLDFSFRFEPGDTDMHPNTVDILMKNADGDLMCVRGESVGGGKVRIRKINGIEVNLTDQLSAVIVSHQDKPGMISRIAGELSRRGINIAFMRVFREAQGARAYTIIETDGFLPEGLEEELFRDDRMLDVMTIQKQEKENGL